MAVPNVVNEAKFIRGMIQIANHHGFDYNIVEAFNQPWKSNLEGVVGANWGLFSADRQAVFPLTGPVSENQNWLMHFIESTALWLLIAGVFSKNCNPSAGRSLTVLILAQVLSVCLITLANYLWYTSYSQLQRGYTVFIVFANTALGALLIQRSFDILAGKAGDERLAGRLRSLYLLFIALALYKTYGLAVAGRYLSFPVEQFSLPVFGICGLIISLWVSRHKLGGRILSLDQLTGWNLHSHRDRLAAYFLSFAVISMVLGETKAFMDGRDFIQAHPGFSEGLPFALSYTLHNQQLLAWLACLAVLSVPFWTNTDRKAKPTSAK